MSTELMKFGRDLFHGKFVGLLVQFDLAHKWAVSGDLAKTSAAIGVTL